QTKEWVGVYLEPAARPDGNPIIKRRLVVPLHDRPWTQSFAKQSYERARAVHAAWKGKTGLAFEGPALAGAAVIFPKLPGLAAGRILENGTMASFIWEYDEGHLAAIIDVPGTYRVR
ncbi:MAG TPA: hypothetical protein DD640_04100, partial [Clostridiales bacterium]|nr:hypothetical protein [Clostridiales bacterium]